jgi:hypothetical protein
MKNNEIIAMAGNATWQYENISVSIWHEIES